MKFPRYALMLVILGLTGCAAAPGKGTLPAGTVTVCEEPRPQVCTADYRPVCAALQDGSIKTYANGCGACGDSNAHSWVEGECPETE